MGNHLISVVIPAYNEDKNIPIISSKIIEIFKQNQKYDFEILFIDDGSTDNSYLELIKLGKIHKNIRAICFSKNFGHQIALTAGLEHSKGDAVICMDSDLQHPPEAIPLLLEKWEKGFDIVYTVRKDNNNTPLFKRIIDPFFYWLINKISNTTINKNSADYRLMGRKALNELLKMKEKDRFIRGMVNWIGFKTSSVEFSVAKRLHGKSKYSFNKLISFGFNAVTSFSGAPLRFSLIAGVFIALSSMIYGTYLIIESVFLKSKFPEGWLTILVCILFLGGLQLIFIGILGEYIFRIYNETKNRPLYIIDQTINIEPITNN